MDDGILSIMISQKFLFLSFGSKSKNKQNIAMCGGVSWRQINITLTLTCKHNRRNFSKIFHSIYHSKLEQIANVSMRY